MPDASEPHVSNSQITMWQRCPKQFKYRYVDGLKRPPSVKMASGSGIHTALETNNLFKIGSGVDMPMEALLDVMSTAHDVAMEDAEEENPGEKGKYKDENVEITRFYRRVQAPHITPIRAEEAFTIIVPADEKGTYLPVIGFKDVTAVVPHPELGAMGAPVLAMEDYKRVTRNRKTQVDADLSLQLTLYDYATHLSAEPLPKVIGLRNLGFNPPRTRALEGPGPYTTPVYRSATLMEPTARARRWDRALDIVRSVQRLIRTGDFPPTDDPQTCSWCGYRDICQDALA